MPRRKSPPRLYLDTKRKQWVIRDGAQFIRTGCVESDRHGAETWLAAYLGRKHKPVPSVTPLIADVLLAYASEHLPHTAAAQNAAYNIGNLSAFWGPKRIGEVTARNCRAYARERTAAAARPDLETLRAAINYWHREYGPLPSVPAVVLPAKAEPRRQWLTRNDSERLLFAARHVEHLKRFILLGLYTGSRSGVLLNLRWDQIDLVSGVMLRKAYRQTEISNKQAPPVKLGRRALLSLRRWKTLDGMRIAHVIHFNGRKIKKLRRSWATACGACGITASPHTLRHTRATWLMQAGVDHWEAAGHLGMSLEMLERVYGKHDPQFQKRAANV
jgi:integrase